MEKYLIILGIACLIFWVIDYLHLFKRPELYFPLKHKKSFFSLRSILRIIIFPIGLMAFFIIILALSGSTEVIFKKNNRNHNNEIIILLDISKSMLAEDFKPNRLEVAKKKIEEFLSASPAGKIGLIIFSERIYTLVPSTSDFDYIKKILKKSVKVGMLGDGTNIGDALMLSINNLKISNSHYKSIILLTDGVGQLDNISPLKAASEAFENNIRIYTVGVGKDKQAKINDQPIPGGSFDPEALKQIAKISNGIFYNVKNIKMLNESLKKIKYIEKLRTRPKILVYKDTSTNILMIGLLILFMVEFFRKIIVRELI